MPILKMEGRLWHLAKKMKRSESWGDNEDLRLSVISELYEQTFYNAAIHVAAVAPEQTAGLKLSQAQAWVRLGRTDRARRVLNQAIELAEDDEEP